MISAACNYKPTSKASKAFSPMQAIAKVIKNNPDFPLSPSEIKTKAYQFGPVGGSINVKFTTKVESFGKDTYLVTLTKDWGMTVNNVYAKRYWEYRVTPNRLILIASDDRDYLLNIVK